MKKAVITLLLGIFLLSFVSSDIVISQQPEKLYNLGDTLNLPTKIVSPTEVKGTLTLNTLCNGIETEVYKADVELAAGDEQSLNPIIILDKSRIGRSTGDCTIKAVLGTEFVLTNSFEISDVINIELEEGQTEFEPEQDIIVEGYAVKQNGENVQGFVEIKLLAGGEQEIELLDTVKNGYFFVNFSLPKETPAAEYLLNLRVYEKSLDGVNITNHGVSGYSIFITQVPTSLELVFETQDVSPGTPLKVKAVLHDQTGEIIDSTAIISIKDENNKILEQIENPTSEDLEYEIKSDEPSEEWTVYAVSNQLTAEANFKIIEKASVSTQLLNKTLIITNNGNILYNKTVTIKIGDEAVEVPVNLKVGQSQKYILTAPDGEYQVEVITEEGSKITGNTILTGSAVDVRKAGGVFSLIRYPLVWVFMAAVLGFVIFTIARKGYKRGFIGKIHIGKKKLKKSKQSDFRKRKSLIKTNNKAEISLSIKGEKQDASLICLKIKNLSELQDKKSNIKETLQEIADKAENQKAVIYENQNNFYLIFAPSKTKTFENQSTALKLAEKIKNKIDENNKTAKDPIEFGIALNHGSIIAKQSDEAFDFMAMGTLISEARKISTISKGQILLGEKIKEKLGREITTEKHGGRENEKYYSIKQIKPKQDHSKFIGAFLKRIEGDNKKN